MTLNNKTNNKRSSKRKIVENVYFSELSDLNNSLILASQGHIVDASTTGFLAIFHRDDTDPSLKGTLSLEHLVGKKVALFLPQMEIDLDGHVSRTKHIGKGYFEVGITFSEDIPEYWRNCLRDLLPQPGEID
jgi:hypothetical protein